ncbi:hypothetical protein Fcan01_22177 [Folsomia candida]|uniref:Gustatory receptor n=1 Tax=Folsomia candida TaxID=158441 RepID=A0A226DBS9_FOLCA|nr:hypothetical protein Fcan01_22177 [Folsomia candida]
MLSTYVGLLLILQNVYFDHFPLLYKLPLEIRRVQGKGIRVAKVTRRLDLVVSLFPGFIFAAAVFLFIVAIWLRFPLVSNPMGDPVILAWALLCVICFCGLVFYTVWMWVYQKEAVVMCNEVLRCEEKLRKVKLTIWTAYLLTPVAAIVTTCIKMDPLLPFFELTLSMIPQLRKIFLYFAFNSKILFQLAMFATRVVCVTVFGYEAFRFMGFCIGMTIVFGNVVISLLSNLAHLMDKLQSAIIHRGLRIHIKFYKVVLIIFQSLEAPMKATASLAIIAGTVAVSGCTFLVVRLHGVNEVYFTLFNSLVIVSSVISTKIILDTLGNLYVTSVKVLLHFRKIEAFPEMGGHWRKLYLKELRYLKAISIPVGLGTARFSRMTQKVKTQILMHMFENCINLLIAF